MRRRAVALLAGVLGLFAASAAGAQTTSTSSTSTSSSTTSTSTTSTSTTSTTIANPCAGQPCTTDPPDAFLSGTAGEVRADLAESCWRDPLPTGLTRCLSALLVPPGATLVVQAGETLSLRFAIGMAPTTVTLSVKDVVTPLVTGNSLAFTPDLPSGLNAATFRTTWLQGDVVYRVTLDVRPRTPTATPRTGPVSLTG